MKKVKALIVLKNTTNDDTYSIIFLSEKKNITFFINFSQKIFGKIFPLETRDFPFCVMKRTVMNLFFASTHCSGQRLREFIYGNKSRGLCY